MGLFEGAVWLKALFFVDFHTNNFSGILDDFSNAFNFQQLRGGFFRFGNNWKILDLGVVEN